MQAVIVGPEAGRSRASLHPGAGPGGVQENDGPEPRRQSWSGKGSSSPGPTALGDSEWNQDTTRPSDHARPQSAARHAHVPPPDVCNTAGGPALALRAAPAFQSRTTPASALVLPSASSWRCLPGFLSCSSSQDVPEPNGFKAVSPKKHWCPHNMTDGSWVEITRCVLSLSPCDPSWRWGPRATSPAHCPSHKICPNSSPHPGGI